MKKLLLLIFSAMMVFSTSTLAQDLSITGTVSDASGSLPGVSIQIKGTSTGTVTDFDGKYTLTAKAGDVLVFSFVGYANKEVTLGNQSVLDITMEEDATQLTEVIVIGYGTTTHEDATGSVVAVTEKDFNRGVIASPEQLIQGKTAGVQITQNSGQPGDGISIRIRGTTSVRSNNNPLFVVDGIPLAGDNTSAGGQDIGFGTSSPENPLNFLNPNDIESISILKDASATAIYGSRGANGVVIITTKSGRGSRGGVLEFSSSVSVASPAKKYDLLERDQFLAAVTQYGGVAADQDFGASTDWQDVVTRTSVSTNQNLSYAQSYDKGSVRGTFGYQNQNGVLENSSLERITGRINAEHRFINDKLKFNLQASLSGVNSEAPAVSGSAGFQGDILGASYSANPTWPNDPNFDTGGQLNPRVMLDYTQSLTKTNRALINFSTSYDITPELTAKVNLGYDNSNSERRSGASSIARNLDRGVFGNGRGALNDIEAKNRLMEATLMYNKNLGNSTLDALVGYSFQDFGRKGRNVAGWGYTTTDLNEMTIMLEQSAQAIENSIAGSYQQYGLDGTNSTFFINRLFPTTVTETPTAPGGTNVTSVFGDTFDFTDELQSFFGRVNYTNSNKYLFTVTVRADGSSRFGENNRYGIFPSGAFAWKINQEDFLGDNLFSTLKLRLGAGITGNQDGLGYGNFIRRERYAGGSIEDGGNVNTPGLAPVSFANPDLKWEETTSYGIGIDFGFMDGRLTGTFDWYRKETTDLLLRVEAAQPSPQPTFFQNLDALVLNQGVEFSINYDFVKTGDLLWDASFNIAYNKNELQNFGGLIPAGTIRGQGLSQAFSQILAEGQPLFSYYLREFEGFDANGQPIGDNQTFVGKSALPDINLGFSTSVIYKDWDFSVFFAGQFGHYVYNNTQNAFFTAGSINNARNVTPDVLTSGEAGNAEAAVSTRFLEKGDFLRLQNATIGYNLPFSGEGAIKSLRFALTGQNLFVITNYSGLDPEVSTNPASGDLLNDLPTAGIDYTSYPRPRTITIGLSATF